MAFTEIRRIKGKRYFYRVESLREGKKVSKRRIYLGVNISKSLLMRKEKEADEKLKEKVIGIIEGGGTGPELANVFREIVSKIYKKESGKEIKFISFNELFGYNLKTFFEFKKHYYPKKYSDIKQIIEKEIKDILKYDDKLLKYNSLGIFRTAINAETLYYLRERAKAIKVVPITISKGNKSFNILFIRDQIQGAYTNKKIKRKAVDIITEYKQKNFDLILDFLQGITKKLHFKDYQIEFIYKYHIVGIELQKMIDNSMRQSKIKKPYRINQPDSGIHYLLHDIFLRKKNKKNIVVICGNEIGDVLLETLIHYYNLGTKETFFTNNYVLGKNKIEALQTMHGSADDIAGKGVVNPTSTINSAAYALENWLSIKGASTKIQNLLKRAESQKIITKDQGGSKTTKQIVSYVLKNWR